MKKRISYLCAILILMHLFLLSVFAVDFQTVSQVSDEKERNAYIANVLPQYLIVDGNELPKDAVVSISDPIQVINNTDDQSRVYLIMVDDQYYAKLIVTSSNGKYYSSFMFDENKTVNMLYQAKTPFALAYVNDELMIVTEDGYESFYHNNTVNNLIDTSRLEIKLKEHQWSVVDVAEVCASQSQRSVSEYSVSLSIPYVANNFSYDDEGICWAAGIAAVSNYLNGTNYTAFSLYNRLIQNYEGNPDGTHDWYLRGYAYCNIPVISQGECSDIMDYYEFLEAGIPVQMAIHHTTETNEGHAIVLRSFEGGNEEVRLGFMDPNTPAVQYAIYEYDAYGNIDAINEFYYPYDEGTYKDIRRIYYLNDTN